VVNVYRGGKRLVGAGMNWGNKEAIDHKMVPGRKKKKKGRERGGRKKRGREGGKKEEENGNVAKNQLESKARGELLNPGRLSLR